MSLRRAASMGAVQTVVSMVLSFFSIKITAVYLGPAGLGTIGQLNYFMAMLQAVLVAGLHTGLVRRTAELGDDRAARELVISTVLRGLIAVGLPVSLVVALLSKWLARELLHDEAMSPSILIFAVTFVLGLVGNVINACANGAKDLRTLAFINIGSAVGAFLMMVALCPLYGVMGGLIATASLPLVTCLVTWALARGHEWWPRAALSRGFSALEGRSALAFVPLAIVGAVSQPLLQILIRDNVAAHSGMASVGLLQGVMRISDMYLNISSTVLVMYFFPRFCEIRDPHEILRELRRGLLIVVPAVAVVSASIYLLREPIVHLIFTAAFLPMRDLFGWQMIGNVLKMASWLFSYLVLAKSSAIGLAGLAILEALTLGLWYLLSVWFIARDGALGATQAYAITYGLNLVTMAIGTAFVLRRMRTTPVGAPA